MIVARGHGEGGWVRPPGGFHETRDKSIRITQIGPFSQLRAMAATLLVSQAIHKVLEGGDEKQAHGSAKGSSLRLRAASRVAFAVD